MSEPYRRCSLSAIAAGNISSVRRLESVRLKKEDSMDFTLNLPVLSLPDTVVLPGMVVPVELDDAAQAVVDAAGAGSDGQLLIAPRLDDRYASYGAVAEIEQLGRLPAGAT